MQIFLGCLDNLLSRGNLKTALSGMDESFLPSVLDLAGDSISNASYSQAISTFLSLFLDEALRGKDLYLNKDVLFRLKALHDKIRNECQVQNAFLVVKGMIESLVS